MNHLAVLVSPSILAADPLNLANEISEVENAGADMHHVDVMDGHYVPNLTFGLPLVAALKKKARIPLDVHLMITNADVTALEYVKAGADFLSFHVEASSHPHRLLQAIRASGAKAGLAINPGTALETLWPLLGSLDFINVMSVNPGFSGQSFIENTTERVRDIAAQLKSHGLENEVRIEVDGGINQETGAAVVRAGARTLVAGAYVYASHERAKRVSALKTFRI